MYTASIVDVVPTRWKPKITIPIRKAIARWTLFLSLVTSDSVLPSVPRISTVKEVVSAVSADPPAAKAQDTRPTTKNIPTTGGSHPPVATAGKRLSPVWDIPLASAKTYISTPRHRNRNITGICSKPPVIRFFWESFALRLAIVRCIRSWSSPVMATTVNIPERNCFQKYSLWLTSSKKNIRESSLLLMVLHIPEKSSPMSLAMNMIASTMEAIMQTVLRVSVQITDFTPPRKV